VNSKKYILSRFIFTVVALWGVATILFLMFRLIPGDPATALIGPNLPSGVRESLRARFGLNEPLYVQYVQYLKGLLIGDLGLSFSRNEPVGPLIFDRTLNTLALMLTALTVAYTIGPLIGAYLAWHRGTTIDSLGIGFVMTMRGAPVFWTGMIAIMIFSFWLNWLPTGGIHSPTYTYDTLQERFVSVDFLYHLVLPVSVVSLYYVSVPTFIARNNMIDVLGEDFMELARAQGKSKTDLIYKHGLRNSLLPVLHQAAISIGFAFGGSVVIEVVFSWPGIGRTLWSAVLASDYPLAQGAFLMIATVIITLNFVADIISAYVDPRTISGGGHG